MSDIVSGTSEHNLVEPVELINIQAAKTATRSSKDIHTAISKLAKFIRDWEENYEKSVVDTVVPLCDGKDGKMNKIE